MAGKRVSGRDRQARECALRSRVIHGQGRFADDLVFRVPGVGEVLELTRVRSAVAGIHGCGSYISILLTSKNKKSPRN